MKTATRPETISRFKKERFLLKMLEDQFRDEVVRPLFFRQGLKDGRDLCGPFERGKDAAFVTIDSLGIEDLYVVQTKKGNLNLAKKAQTSLIEAVTQVRTALDTRVTFIKTKEKKYPSKVILCVSGKINDSARTHIVDEIKDPRIVFLDSDELIPKIDEVFPELWLGIDAEIGPYFRKLKGGIEDSNENLSITDFLPAENGLGSATEANYVPLQLYRTVLIPKKVKGQIIQEPDFQQIPITALLNKKERRFLILGDAGSGKSTAIKRLAYVMVTKGLKFEDDIRVPVLLRALDLFNRTDSSLASVCADETKKITDSSKPSFSNGDLLGGRVCVLIDALDELADDDARQSVLQVVEEFHEAYPKCQIIATSRNYAFTKTMVELRQYESYRISPINYQQAEKIITTLQKAKKVPVEKSREILRRLENVHGIELNPLLVTVFAAITDYTRQDIPANITELFKKYTEMMLGRWDASKGMAQQYHAPLKDFVLTQVAFEMHRRNTTSMSISEFESVVERELTSRGYKADLPQLLEEMVHRSGLFRVFEESIEFRHFLLQEFFAGRGIPSVEFLEAIIGEEWWQRAIVFYFGEHPSDGKSIDAARQSLGIRPIGEIHQAAMTLGLAIQACYLVEVDQKIDIYRWVIESLANSKEWFVEDSDDFATMPLRRFIFYYLLARDSVALSVLEPKVDEIIRGWEGKGIDQQQRDTQVFWVIIGLLESGSLKKAEELLKKYRPSDPRLLLAIYLGCFLIQHLRTGTKEQLKTAQRIAEGLSVRIQHLRGQLLKEVRSELLELRQGKIAELEAPKSSDS